MIIYISILVILLTTAGQVFLKIGADKAEGSQSINRFVVFGYALFLITIILSYFLMKIIPLKYFTVIMSLNYVAVMIAAKMFLGEEVKKDRLTGTALIALGIIIFLWK